MVEFNLTAIVLQKLQRKVKENQVYFTTKDADTQTANAVTVKFTN